MKVPTSRVGTPMSEKRFRRKIVSDRELSIVSMVVSVISSVVGLTSIAMTLYAMLS